VRPDWQTIEKIKEFTGGIPRRGGDNDPLSTLWREVISRAGVARSFSKAWS
jgi:hypothetical protein